MSVDRRQAPDQASRRAWLIAAVMLALVARISLVQPRWTHRAGISVWVVVLLCPLMHRLMHGGHSE